MKKTLFLSAILGAILAVPTMAEVTYGGTIYTYTPKNGSNQYLHNATFTETTIVDGEFVVGTNTVGYGEASANNKSDNTLRYVAGGTATTSQVQFNDLTIGGVIVDADSTITTLENAGDRTFYIGVDNKTSGSSINKSFTIKTTSGSINLRGTQEIAIAEGQTLTLSASSSIALTNNANVTVSGTGTLGINKSINLGTGSTLTLSDGMTLAADNVVQSSVTLAVHESGLQNGSATYTLAGGAGSVARTGTQKMSIGGVTQTIETWAADNKSFSAGAKYYCVAQEGNVTVNSVNSAISGSSDLVAGIWVDGTLTNITGNAVPSRAVFGNGVVKITGDYGKGDNSQLGSFNGTLHITGASARTLFYTSNNISSDAVVELGVRGQIVSDKGTFTNKITIADFSESGIGDSLLPTIYANSGSNTTINSVFELNGHTLFKQGAGTLNVTTKAAVSSLLGSGVANNGKLVIDGGGTLILGAKNANDFGDNYGTAIEVRNGTLDLRTENLENNTKTFNGDLTMKGGTLSLYDGGAKFTGNVNLVSGDINMNSDWGKMGIELAGLVSGSANVYMTSGANNRTETYTISHADNTFSGTYVVGKNSKNTVAGSKVTLKATADTALQNATVNLDGGDKSALLLTTDTATVGTLSGVNGSTVTTSATATELQVGAGEFAGIISGAISLNKVGSGTLTLSAKNTYTGTTTITAGTLKLTDGDETGLIKGEVTVKNGATLDLAGNDSLGWGINNVTALNIEQGGKLFVSAAGQRPGQAAGNMYNQTFQKMAITLTGATISGNEGATIDLFNNNNVAGNYTTLTVNAADGATAANPTVSTVDSNVTLKLRQNSTTITVADNAKLVIANGLKKNGGTPVLVKAGAGSLTLGAASDYNGGTTISEGTIVMGNAASLGTGAVTIASGATLDVNGNTIANAITTAGNIVNNGSELYSLSNGLQNVTLSGNAVIGGSKAISMVKNGGTDTATLAMGGHTLTVSNTKGLYMNKTDVTGGGAIDVTKGEIVFFGSVAAVSTKLNLNDGTKLMINADSSIGGLTGSGSIGVAVANDSTGAKNDSTLTINTVSDTTASSAATIDGENHLTIKKTGAGEQIFTGALNDIKSIVVEEGDLTVKAASTVKQLGGSGTVKALADLTVTEGNVKLGGLVIGGDKTVMLGTEESHNNTLTLNNLTVTGSGSTINANLAVSGGTMTMSSSLEMGCSVTLGLDSEGNVSKEALTLPNASSEGPLAITILFTGVESLTLGALGEVSEGWYDASEVFSTLTIGEGSAVTINPNEYVIGYWGTTVSIADKSVPEPATATLSLLALAALAARRKRK